jgi:ribosomal protein S7
MQKILNIRFKKLLKIKNLQLLSKKQSFLIPNFFFFKLFRHIGGFFKYNFRISNFIRDLDCQKKIWIDFNKHNFFSKYRNKKYFLLRYFFRKTFRKLRSKKNKKKQAISFYINLYSYLVKFITRFGKMSKIKKTLTNVFLKLYKSLKISKIKVLLLVFLRLYTKVEIRHIKIRRRIHVVPFLISIERQFFLTLKWLLVAVQQNKERCSYEKKIFLEIINVIKNKAFSIGLLEKNNNLASKNRSNAHFRW